MMSIAIGCSSGLPNFKPITPRPNSFCAARISTSKFPGHSRQFTQRILSDLASLLINGFVVVQNLPEPTILP